MPPASPPTTTARRRAGMPTPADSSAPRPARHERARAGPGAELVSLLAPEPGQTAVDCTFGAGGHARRVADRLGPEGTLIAIDRDPAAAARFAEFAAEAPCRTRFVGADFAAGLRALHGEGIRPEMIYMDLGMSSMQVDAWERGFSYAYDAPLDMRMDTRQDFDAAQLLNEWPEARIAQVLRRYGEERYAGGIAREIVRRRPLSTTSELVAAIKAGMPAAARFGGGHPAKRSFQAIRIAVNGELDSLERGAAAGLGDAPGRRPPRRDRLPLARGPAGQAVPRRQGARLRLPARASRLRLRARAGGGAPDPPRGLARPGRGRGQPALALGASARRPQDRRGGAAGGGRLMAVAAPKRRTAPAPAAVADIAAASQSSRTGQRLPAGRSRGQGAPPSAAS